jgi:hypothetical protein
MLLIALAALLVQAPQTPQPAPATVEGRVLKFGTGEPMGDVTVELQRMQAAPGTFIPPVKTNPDGRFRLQNVPPADYRLYATHSNGYVPAEYGQRIPTGIGIPFTLAAGQTMDGITLSMTRTATISGRVVDANNDPIVYASVLAFRFVYREGVRTVEVVQSVLTDDKGEFRAYWLAPGKYYLSALPIGQRQYNLALAFPSRVGGAVYVGNPLIAVRASETGELVEETYLPTYYPGTMDVRSAQPIVLQPNDNLKVNFNVGNSTTRTLQVRGTVYDGEGKPLPFALVQMAVRKPEGHSVLLPTGTTDATGAFTLRGVTPGSYSLFVMQDPNPQNPNLARGVSSLPAPTILMSGTQPLDVGTSSVENVRITTSPTANIPWQVAYEPRTNTDQEPKFNVSLKRDPDIAGAAPVSLAGLITGAAAPAGALPPPPPPILTAINAGDYRVVVSPIPSTGYVKSIKWGNVDVLKEGLHVNGPTRDALEIVVSANGGTLEGTILDAARDPFSNATIALLPNILQRQRLDLYKTTSSDKSGKFRIEGIAPGEYRVFAWEGIQQGDWYDAEIMRNYEARGATVEIEEGKMKSVNVTVVPARDIQ